MVQLDRHRAEQRDGVPMTRALILAAIEQCERDGHLFRWVRAWHDCGFYECDRCGETKAQERLTLPAAPPEATVRDCSPPSATVHNCPESVRRTPPDDSPLSAPPRGRGAPPKAQRNAEIVRRLAQGESVESVRQAFGLSWQRIYQIKEAAKRRPHTIGEPQGSATASE